MAKQTKAEMKKKLQERAQKNREAQEQRVAELKLKHAEQLEDYERVLEEAKIEEEAFKKL